MNKIIEISIYDFILLIFKYMWLILVITITTFFIGYFYVKNMNNPYIGTIEIFPLQLQDISKYERYNIKFGNPKESTQSFSDQKFGKSIEQNLSVIINNNLLFNNFISYLDNPSNLKKLIIKYNLIDLKNSKDDYEINNLIRSKMSNISIEKQINSENGTNSNLQKTIDYSDYSKVIIKYIANEKNEIINFLSRFFKAINEENRILLEGKINNKLDFIQENNKDKKIFYKNKIDLSIFKFQQNKQARINFLKEQQILAESLGLNNPSQDFSYQFSDGIFKYNNLDDFQYLYFLRGTILIEKEIDYLLELKTPDDSEDYIFFVTKLRELESSPFIESYKNHIALLPSANIQSFKSISYDIGLVNFDKTLRVRLILSIFFIIGVLISLITVIFIVALRKN